MIEFGERNDDITNWVLEIIYDYLFSSLLK